MAISNAEQAAVNQFVQSSGVAEMVTALKAKIRAEEEAGKPFIVSDIFDSEGNQYADLVQEGGGVWGIALLGYTYVMEQVGIRFFSLAGTSAGAINTMLMAANESRSKSASEKLIAELLALDLFSLVDGKKGNWQVTRWVKKIIQKFVLKKNYMKRAAGILLLLFGLLVVTNIAGLLSYLISASRFSFWVSIIALATWSIVLFLIVFAYKRIKTIARSGYGLNAGNRFYDWISSTLKKQQIDNLEDLKKMFCCVPQQLFVREDRLRDALHGSPTTAPANPMLVIVASDITTGNKIEFPRMWDMFWDNLADVPPAAFVRASMSIPLFFETCKIPVSLGLVKAKEKWQDHINWNGKIPEEVQMVDGGALSNFPINVFYNSSYVIPRMPTFGVRLGGDGIQTVNEIRNFGHFISAIIGTLRSNTDKDFINRNKAFDAAVKEVNMSEHSWLNFFMDDDEKQKIFAKGAEAAVSFITGFNWQQYKQERKKNIDVLTEQKENPNNW